MARPLRYDYPGAIHHIFVRGNNKQNIFSDDQDKEYWIICLEDALKKRDGKVHSFGLNDNHNHMVYESGEVGMSRFMHLVETKYALYFKKKYDYTGHVFQGRYGSVLIQEDDERHYITANIYVIRNPLAAGVCDDLLSYKFTSLNSYFAPKQYPFIYNKLIRKHFKTFDRFLSDVMMDEERTVVSRRIKDYKFFADKEFVEKKIKESQSGERIENREYQRMINVGDIEKFISSEYGFGFNALKSCDKARKYSDAKMIAVYLLYARVHQTHRQINEILGFSSGEISKKIRRVDASEELMEIVSKFDSKWKMEEADPKKGGKENEDKKD